MITQKVIEIAKKAKQNYLKENTIYTSEEVEYGLVQEIVKQTIQECICVIEKTNLTHLIYTTFDHGMVEGSRKKIQENLLDFKKEI